MTRTVTLLALAAALLLPSSAGAAYSLAPWTDCLGSFNGGSYDDAGNLYVACSSPNAIRVYGPDGAFRTQTAVAYTPSDAAPSPDGQYVYTASSEANTQRLVRQGDGSYAVDAGWSAANYDVYGTPKPPRGKFIDTDSAGNVYLAIGAWVDGALHAVVKYAPDGQKITQFGEYTFGQCGQGVDDPAGWALGQFCWMLTGVVAVGDGAVVYTTEVGNNRVQKWTRNPNGTYTAVDSFGGTAANDPDRAGGDCAFTAGQEPDAFSAPYDVAADGAGNVYVMNTTCHDVVKLTSAMLVVENVDLGDDTTGARPHAFAVALNGNVCVAQSRQVLVQPGTPAPCTALPAGAGDGGGGGTAPPPADGGGTGENPASGDPAPQSAPDTTPPTLIVQAARAQRIGRQRGIRLSVMCDEPCRLSAQGTIKLGRTTVKLARTLLSVSPGRPFRIRLAVHPRALRRLAAALAAGRRLTARVVVRAHDARGNDAPVKRVAVRLRG